MGRFRVKILPMNSFRESLAKRLRQLRKKECLSQEAFALKIGITQSSLNRIEIGEQNVTLDTLQTICRHLKCSAADLLDE